MERKYTRHELNLYASSSSTIAAYLIAKSLLRNTDSKTPLKQWKFSIPYPMKINELNLNDSFLNTFIELNTFPSAKIFKTIIINTDLEDFFKIENAFIDSIEILDEIIEHHFSLEYFLTSTYKLLPKAFIVSIPLNYPNWFTISDLLHFFANKIRLEP